MKNEDIIGKEFICFEFPSGKVNFDAAYRSMIGRPATVLNLHEVFPDWANARISLKDGSTESLHYPTAMVKQQIEENEKPIDIDSLFEEINNKFKQLNHE